LIYGTRVSFGLSEVAIGFSGKNLNW